MKPDFSKMSLQDIMQHFKKKDIFKVELPSYVNFEILRERIVTLSYRESFDMSKSDTDPYFLSENRWLRNSSNIDRIFNEIGGDYVTRKGRFIKRFEREYEELRKVKLSPVAKSLIGDLVREIAVSVSYYVDFVDEIDWEDGEFGKEDSCWWGCYDESREVFINGGGWGIRFYKKEDEEEDFEGIGRVWVFPFESCKTFVLFNAYLNYNGGPLDQFARLLANLCGGLIYKRVSLENRTNGNVPYINNNTGYAVSFTGEFKDTYDLNLGYSEYECDNCGCALGEDNHYDYDDSIYCEDCYDNMFSDCDICGYTKDKDDLTWVDSTNQDVCSRCLDIKFFTCEDCGEIYNNDDLKEYKSNYYCEDCYNNLDVDDKSEEESSNEKVDLYTFKVGDHVICDPKILSVPYSITNHNMLDAEIIRIYSNHSFRILIRNHRTTNSIGEAFDVDSEYFIRNIAVEEVKDEFPE